MHNHFWHHPCQEKLVQSNGEPKACPVVSIFKDFQTIAVEINVTVKVHLKECPHWYLVFAPIFHAISIVMKCKVMLDRAARKSSFLVFARSESGHDSPECGEDRNAGKYCKEYSCFQTAANLP